MTTIWAKPYSFAELLARIEALARRADRSRLQAVLRVCDLEIDTASRAVSRAGQAIDLQRREFVLLEYLVRHAGQVVTRAMLLEAAWSNNAPAHSTLIDMHIHRLRRKVDDGFLHRLIQTVPGAGYMVREPE